MAPPPPKLLPSSSSSDESDDEESDSDRAALPINEDYARRFEHNKRREDLHRLSDLQKRGLLPSSSSSSSNDDDSDEDPVASTKTDLQFFDALVKVKLQDPLIHLKNAKLYASDDEDSDDVAEKKIKKEKEKPMYIKDVTAKHLLEDGPEFDETPAVASQSKLYSREQEDNRRAFLDAAEFPGSDDDAEFFKEKANSEARPEDPDNAEVRRKMDEYFGEDNNLDENELFLKNFMKKRMWTAEADGGAAEDGEISEDEDELEKQEKYEAEYNFRYEEGVGDRVLGHARVVEGSVRKKNNARKEQRKRREERAAQVEAERKEELKRLKNLKKREIEEKLEKIRAVAGIQDGGVSGLDGDDLEEEFDPNEYDRKMKEMFDEDYYGAEDADPDFRSGDEGDIEKPDFDKEDELLGLPKSWDVGCTGDGFKTAREKSMKRKEEARAGEKGQEDEEEEEEEDEVDEENRQREGKSKRKRKRKITLREKVELDKELEEYYKLDYEDTIGDLKTRFKYKSVPSNKYGLNAAEILMADERDLNQYVSLKKLAPYRQDEWKAHKMKKHQILTKLYNQGENAEHGKGDEKHHSKGSHSERSGKKPQDAVTNGDVSGQDLPSRRSRRRRRQSELKLSQSRLMAYGKVAHNPKKQKKH